MRHTLQKSAPGAAPAAAQRALAWPGDAESLTAADVDFEALAYVLANTCRWGGRTRQYHSLAAHGVIASEEIAALDGLPDGQRRQLALHALIADAPAAWLQGEPAGSQRAAERAAKLAAGIERAVREAAGLAPELDAELAELLRFVLRMTEAAERRDLAGADPGAGAGAAFPPLKRRLRAVAPAQAARLWLERFQALRIPPSGAALNPTTPRTKETDDVAGQTKEGSQKPDRDQVRRAA